MVSNQPIYPAWTNGGTSINFVSSFDYSLASTSAYAVTTPSILDGVVTKCNDQAVNFRAKFYWTITDTVRYACPLQTHTRTFMPCLMFDDL